MAAILIEEPAIEPLTLAEAKTFLRVEHSTEDELISSLIKTARQEVEATTRRALITQTWRLALDCWPHSGLIVVPIAPLRAIVAARVRALNGTPSDLDLSAFTLDTVRVPGLIRFDRGRFAAPGQRIAGIELEVTVGHGESAASVPEPLRQAMRLLIAHYYEHRDHIDGDVLNSFDLAD